MPLLRDMVSFPYSINQVNSLLGFKVSLYKKENVKSNCFLPEFLTSSPRKDARGINETNTNIHQAVSSTPGS